MEPAPAPAGQRARSEITIEINVTHDGDPDVLADHLAVEVRALLKRIDPWVELSFTTETIDPGDELSLKLPAWR